MVRLAGAGVFVGVVGFVLAGGGVGVGVVVVGVVVVVVVGVVVVVVDELDELPADEPAGRNGFGS